jgi:dihydromethanopterin reductase (acceptor)
MEMSLAIAWAITGAGHFLKETFEVMSEVVKDNDIKVTTYLSTAGCQVVKMYGLWEELKKISKGGYLQEIFIEDKEGAASPKAGRLLRGIYKFLIVSPATANTVAKIVHGVADTLVTNAVAQAQKGAVPIYIVPTDQQSVVETALLYRVDRSVCKSCEPCPAISICPQQAIKVVDNYPNIDITLCRNCKLCITACLFGAIKYEERVKLRLRKIDVENVERLKKMEGITVLEHPKLIMNIVRKWKGGDI